MIRYLSVNELNFFFSMKYSKFCCRYFKKACFNLPSSINSATKCNQVFFQDGCFNPYLGFLLPEEVCQLLDSSAPKQERQRVEVPDVELVVQGTTEAHADEVGSK